jgi:hypothetical protein
MIADEAWAKGSWFQSQANKIFEDQMSFLLGLGQPVVVFVVQEVGYDGVGNTVGCSAGPFVDWIAVEISSVAEEAVLDGSGKFHGVYPPTVVGDNPPPTGSKNPAYAPYTIAHEICHSLGLLGHANAGPGDLMSAQTLTGDALSPFQVGIIRSSARVTFF